MEIQAISTECENWVNTFIISNVKNNKICFYKFLFSLKEELNEKFIEFTNNKNENIKEIEMVEQNIPIKKKRGRPKKNTNSELKSELKPTPELKPEPELKSEPELKPKKKRGRPPKKQIINNDEVIITSVDDSDDDLLKNTNKVGRPNLKEQHNYIEVNNEKEPIIDNPSIDVFRIEIDDKVYLCDTDKNLYTISDQEHIGKYDEFNKTIIV